MASGSEKRQLPQVVSFRVTDAEREAWQRRADHAGLSVGGYIRSVLSQTSAPPPRRRRQPVQNGEALARVLAGLGKIGSNVNQLAHAANLNNWPEARLHEEARQDIRAMRDLLMQALGVRQHDHSDHEAG